MKYLFISQLVEGMMVEGQGLQGPGQPQEVNATGAEDITDLDMLLKREREMERLRKEGEGPQEVCFS